MKHLHNFDTVAEYEAAKGTLEMPYIVSIDETDGLQYNTEVIRVPQGSEGSSGESGGSSWRYFDIKNLSDETMKKNLMPFLVKDNNGVSYSMMIVNWTNVEAVGVDGDAMMALGGTKMSWNNVMQAEGLTPEVMAQLGIIEITEAEFYDLNA